MKINLFSSLSKNISSKDENFLTEAFVYSLQTLIARERKTAERILINLCGEKTETWFSDNQIEVLTQISTTEGRPDIVIKAGKESIIYIEVKHDSGLGWKQLERYYQNLEGTQLTKKQLVLLTRSRHSIQETSLDADKFHHVCWYEISGWFSELELETEISEYLVEQFLDFLFEKDMSMEKIKWEYIEGIPALVNFANMLGTAIAETLPEEKVRRTAGWNWIGYYIGEDLDIWIGVRYQDHLRLVMENNGGKEPTNSWEFSFTENHFFSLSAGEQLEKTIAFINESKAEYVREERNTPE